jgi:DNA primase small subunit
MQESKEAIFLKKHFKDYYKKNFIDTVSEVNTREFGYGVFKRKIANRNLKFNDAKEMNEFLRNETPLFFSYSNSYYQNPGNTPMNTKGWLRSDLIYEFDADEITTVCNKENNEWECTKKFGEDAFIEEVESADGEVKQWFSKKGLLESKKQVLRLVEFFEDDFGFDLDKLAINFSGKAGYHVHLRNENIQHLNKKARIELVDYIVGKGIYFDNLGYDLSDKLNIAKAHGGWQKRINKGLVEFFEKDAEEISKITGTSRSRVKKYLEDKDDIIKKIKEGNLIGFNLKKNRDFFTKIFNFIVETYTVPIDRQTSIDLHKIIRVPNTLHGDTGFVAKKLNVSDLDDFKPYDDSVVFGNDEVKVHVPYAPKFSLKGEDYGPFNNCEVNVPLHTAIYLIGKGATLV